jgi:hypothetical protein
VASTVTAYTKYLIKSELGLVRAYLIKPTNNIISNHFKQIHYCLNIFFRSTKLFPRRNANTVRKEFAIRSWTDRLPGPFERCLTIRKTDLGRRFVKWFRRRTAKTNGPTQRGFWNRWRKRFADFRGQTLPTTEESWKWWIWILLKILENEIKFFFKLLWNFEHYSFPIFKEKKIFEVSLSFTNKGTFTTHNDIIIFFRN